MDNNTSDSEPEDDVGFLWLIVKGAVSLARVLAKKVGTAKSSSGTETTTVEENELVVDKSEPGVLIIRETKTTRHFERK